MFKRINEEFNARKRAKREERFILESVLDVEEVLPGSEEEMEDVTDVDSVPEDVYKKIDAELEKIVSDPNYDDTEADEMADDDIYGDVDSVPDEVEAIIDEACSCDHGNDDEDDDEEDDEDEDLDEGCRKRR